jgi:hypothetical protein
MKKEATPIYLMPSLKTDVAALAKKRGISLSSLASMVLASEVNEARKHGELNNDED